MNRILHDKAFDASPEATGVFYLYRHEITHTLQQRVLTQGEEVHDVITEICHQLRERHNLPDYTDATNLLHFLNLIGVIDKNLQVISAEADPALDAPADEVDPVM